VSVLPDVSGIDKTFDYRVPPELAASVCKGTIVRIRLAGRTLRGWVVDDDVDPPAGVEVRDLVEVSSIGPPGDIVDLARWATWRYAGRLRPFLLAASPPRRVRSLPLPAVTQWARKELNNPGFSRPSPTDFDPGRPVSVVRLAPAASRLDLVEQVASEASTGGGNTLVVLPTRSDASRLVSLLRRSGRRAAHFPDDWAAAAAGGTVVVGARSAAFAPLPRLGAIVVLDAHAETLTETRAPTWNAAVVAAARAAVAGVPCWLVSPCPSLELLAAGELFTPPGQVERQGWAPLQVVDRRDDDPRAGLYSEVVVGAARHALAAEGGRPVVFVINRTGSARHVRCSACGALARCENCGAALSKGVGRGSDDQLACPRGCGSQPPVCDECGSTRLKLLSLGTKRAATDLAHLLNTPVAEVTAERTPADLAAHRAIAGTEAVFTRVAAAALVVFLDFDLDLASPRLRAEEHALSLLAGASRLVGGRRRAGRVIVQTRLPDHEVLAAAVAGDPALVSEPERRRRERLRLPPVWAVALLSGTEAGELAVLLETAHDLEVAEVDSGFLVRAPSEQLLCDALAATSERGYDTRIEVDPLRL
jgi:primosomal protein N' (replication factor Y) (superfamily II helicase)